MQAGYPTAGEMIGPYRIVRRLGGGGMGVVYEAADEALNRQVAVKVIAPDLAENPAFRERFTREALALAALDSPGVVHVYAHGEDDGRLYIATQLIPDGDLGAMLQSYGAPPIKVALDLIAQVAAGLSDAHAAGMIHRDIKPANILLRRRGNQMQAYLGDFGIARNLAAEDPELERATTIGTPSYMAPELHTGGDAGVATDVYALGCLLWAALSGRAPYTGTSEQQIVAAHLEQPVPQLPGDNALVQETNRILRTAMAKNPADRYVTAAQLHDDLRRVKALPVAGAVSRAAGRPDGGSRVWLIAAVLVLMAALIGGAIYLGLRGGSGSTADDPTRPRGSTTGHELSADEVEVSRDMAQQLVAVTPTLTTDQAQCVAREWIGIVGLDELKAEGFVDDELRFHNLPEEQMSPTMRAASLTAAARCSGLG
jgi:serine/threonine-protein kinase